MKRFTAILLAFLVCISLVTACGLAEENKTYVDGTYTARFKEPSSSNDYVDYLIVTVSGGVVTGMEYDAYYKDDETQLRSQDEKYERDMNKVSDTYPRRYGPDLVNQYMEKGDIDLVDDVAGATWSSESFKALFKALEPSMQSGSTEVVLVDNVLPR